MKKILTTALIAATLATSAMAFEQQGVKEGNSRVGVNAMYMSVTPDGGDSIDMGLITGSYAAFLTDSVELGLGLTYIISDDNSDYTLTPFAKYNFVDVSPTVVPYVGLGFAYMNGDSTEEAETGYNAEGGVKIFTSETTAITTALFYEAYDEFDITGLKIGIEIYFD